jgi:hypothetical protein
MFMKNLMRKCTQFIAPSKCTVLATHIVVVFANFHYKFSLFREHKMAGLKSIVNYRLLFKGYSMCGSSLCLPVCLSFCMSVGPSVYPLGKTWLTFDEF